MTGTGGVTAAGHPIGVSSGSRPRSTAAELLDTVADLGLDRVDLRFGKGHAWEADGLDPFEAAGIGVAFVGIGLSLGEGAAGPDALAAWSALLDGRHLPLKVFASAALDDGDADTWRRAEAQVARLQRISGRALLVETHHGYAGLPALDALSARLGCEVLFDVGGFVRLTGGWSDPAGVVARRSTAIQVKGIDPTVPERHLPVRELPAAAWALLDAVAPDAPVLVESRSGTLADDIHTIRTHHAAQSGRR